jgi:hypothetical protein
MPTTNVQIKRTLPVPVIPDDLVRPGYDSKIKMVREEYGQTKYTQYGGQIEFELWYTERFGWIIPTLQIAAVTARRAARGATLRRTYAIAIKDGALVRAGFGPHVLEHHTVYVKASRLDALTPLLDLAVKGEADAGDCRDRISTRRAQTAMRRSSFMGGAWDS